MALAVLASGIYTGAAWYVAFVELPALTVLPLSAANALWAESVRRTPRYAASALVAAATGFIAGNASLSSAWTWGALTIFCVLPFTAVSVLPIQRRLLTVEGSLEWSPGIARWGKLHAVRVVLGLIAMTLFLSQMVRQL
jgi:hypothetical protein